MTNRNLAMLAAFVWAVALAMAGLYIWNVRGDGSASGARSPNGAAAVTAATAPDNSSVSTSTATTAPLSTTTTDASPTTLTSTSASNPATTSTTAPPPPALAVAAGGDVLGDRGVGSFIDKNGGDAVLAKVKPYLQEAHVAFVNLECPISDKGARKPGKEYTFRGRTALAEGLASAGIDVVSLANNHTLDYGPAALIDTLARLDDAGVAYAGAGANASAAQAPAILTTPAGTVAVLAFTDIVPGGFPATSKNPGVNPATDRTSLLAAVAAADNKADFVLVSFHWGTEYTRRPSESQRRLAHKAIDAGADLILGHHPHVIQGLEIYQGKLIAYSLGDFVFDHYSRETGEAFILQVTMTPRETLAAEMIPVYLNDSTGIPAPVSGREADVILTRLAGLSRELGLELTRMGDRALFTTEASAIPSPAASP